MRSISRLSVYLFALVTICFSACKFSSTQQEQAGPVVTAASDSLHPSWILQSNVYEVNIRQFTKEGTFRAMATHFDRLRDMGVEILWLMPVTPISSLDRKGTLGSYYAVADYRTINPEFGTMEDFKWFVDEAHKKGFKVITDWVANHTGADHPWVTNHTNFYNLDSAGKPKSVYDWTDTRELNFDNKAMRDSMTENMKFWIRETGIDGFRCDVAGEVPDDYWAEVIPQLRQMKEIFMLAEGDKPGLHAAGFNASYPWDVFQAMKKVANGSTNALVIDTLMNRLDTFPAGAIRLYFTSNHDENSWNKSDFETFPSASHAPFAVLTQTLRSSLPLIYSGQEEPVLRAVSFFEKDSMGFKNYGRAAFYKTLLNLRSNNKALAVHSTFNKISTGNDKSLYAFIRSNGKDKVFVLVNLTGQKQIAELNDTNIDGHAKNVFDGKEQDFKGKTRIELAPWDYKVLEYVK
jgi:alpha-amylase